MRTILTALAALTTAVAVTACSNAIEGTPQHPARVSPVEHTSSASMPSVSASVPPSDPAPYPSSHATVSSNAPSAGSDVDRTLLGTSDLGPGFAAAQTDPPAPLPCTPNRPPVDDQVPHTEKGDAVFVDDIAGEQVSEQIYVYGSVDDASRHDAIVTAGLSCRHGTLGGVAVTVLGPTDVRSRLAEHPDAAKVWIVRTAQVSGALVAVRLHAVLVQVAVVTQNGDTATLDVEKVVEAALRKLLAVARG